MLVFSKARLVFLSMPKTGTSAYAVALAPHAAMVVSDPPALKHAPVFRYNRFFRPMLEKFVEDKMDVIAVMREPLSWLGSWYRFRQRSSMLGHPNSTHDITFDDFVLAYMKGTKPAFAEVGSQVKFLEPQNNGTAVTHLFRYENQPGLVSFLEERLKTTIVTTQVNVSPAISLEISIDVQDRFRRKFSREFRLYEGIGEGGQYTRLPISN